MTHSPRQIFSATVRKIDINPYVAVPDRIVRSLLHDARKEAGPIPVTGKLEGKSFLATVVKFRGKWRLYLNTAMRRDAGVNVGDEVTVALRVDETPRVVPAPRAFTIALSNDKKAKAAFENLAPSRQRDILRYLNNLKRPDTLERNIQRAIRFLRGGQSRG